MVEVKRRLGVASNVSPATKANITGIKLVYRRTRMCKHMDRDGVKMTNPWFRLYSEFHTDPKIQMLSEQNQRRYIMILCMRCSNGDVTLQDKNVAFQLRISNDEWASTKDIFIENNLIDIDNKPVSWGRRQYASDSSKSRVYKHRQKKKQKCNVTVTPPDTDTDTDIIKKEDVPSSKKNIGTRIPDGALLSEEFRQFAEQEGHPDPGREWLKFTDYWRAQPGQKGVKLDWLGTWRNWIRRAVDDGKSRKPTANRAGSRIASDEEIRDRCLSAALQNMGHDTGRA